MPDQQPKLRPQQEQQGCGERAGWRGEHGQDPPRISVALAPGNFNRAAARVSLLAVQQERDA
ncbi:MAG: hypothetical protein ABIP55_03105 [Tepidisphaeraceae bacterium]